MGAAAWALAAEDITQKRDAWASYLDIAQLSAAIGLATTTIEDILTRRPQEEDPRHAIYRPAARIGQSALNATPMWSEGQRDAYLNAVDERDSARRVDVKALPVIGVSEQGERGLSTIEELAGETGRAENTLRRWRREDPDFPAPVGKAERVPPFQYGPPRILYVTAQVQEFSAAKRDTPREPAA